VDVAFLLKAKERKGKKMKSKKSKNCQTGALLILFALSACEQQNGLIMEDLDHSQVALSGPSDSAAVIDKAQMDEKSDFIVSDVESIPAAPPTAPPDLNENVQSDKMGALLRKKLATWNVSALLREPAESTGFARDDALSTLCEISGKETASYDYFETRKNERIVYKNTTGETVKHDPRKGFWKYIGKENSKKDEARSLTNEEAKVEVEEIFSSLGLSGKGDVYVRGVGISDNGAESVEAVGRLVRIHREINGAKVLGSRISAFYGADGALVSFEVSWPDFDVIEGCNILSRDAFIERLSTEDLRAFNTIADNGDIWSRMVYAYNEKSGKHEPAIQIEFDTDVKYYPRQNRVFSLCKDAVASVIQE
jgi:hypothetical protein